MAQNKRKRDSNEPAPDRNGSTGEESVAEALALEDSLFQVEVLSNNKKPPAKKQKTKSWSEVKTERLPGSGKEVHYRISPGDSWESIRKYKNFVVADKTFGVGDYIFVRHNDDIKDLADDGQGWVGQVLEIRARDQAAVFVRIFWLYWQAELPPSSQEPYHGKDELIMSDFMQIIDAQTVDGSANVTFLNEDDHDSKPADGYYWRQNFYHKTNKLGPVKSNDCTCKKPHNPDTLLVQCESCGQWQHELCIRDSVLLKRWEELAQPKENGVNGASADLLTPTSTSDTIAVTPRKNTSTKKKGGKKSNAKGKAQTPEWETNLDGMLERDEQALKKGDDVTGKDVNITGMVVITDRRDPSGSRVLRSASCLHCGASLASKKKEEEEALLETEAKEEESGEEIKVGS